MPAHGNVRTRLLCSRASHRWGTQETPTLSARGLCPSPHAMNSSTKRAEPEASRTSPREAASPATPSRKRVRLVLVQLYGLTVR